MIRRSKSPPDKKDVSNRKISVPKKIVSQKQLAFLFVNEDQLSKRQTTTLHNEARGLKPSSLPIRVKPSKKKS